MEGDPVGDYVCVATFGFADGSHEQHVLLSGTRDRCDRLARRLERATAPRRIEVPRGDGTAILTDAPKRLLKYPGERQEKPVGAVVAVCATRDLGGLAR